jgi:hypothetical protein
MTPAWISSKAQGFSWKALLASSGDDYPQRGEWRGHTDRRRRWRWMDLQVFLTLLGGSIGLAQSAWAARGISFRGQWSLGNLIGALIILGILVGLVALIMWPRRRS